MLSFYLRFDDLAAPCAPTADTWRMGRSFIAPFAHPALEFRAYEAGQRRLFVIRERDRSQALAFPDPGPVAVSETALESAMQAFRNWPLHAMAIEIDAGGITLYNGSWGVAPVFLLADAEGLRGHWNQASLYPHARQHMPDPALAAYYLLAYHRPYSRQTLWPDIFCLTERATAHCGPARELLIVYPEAVAPTGVQALRPDADVVGMFGEILDAALRRWTAPEELTMCAELSGGLDSGVVSIVAARQLAAPLQTYGLHVAGDSGPTQVDRRAALVQRYGFRDSHLDMRTALPFDSQSRRLQSAAFDTMQGCYFHAFDRLFGAQVPTRPRLMFNGFGGDELCLPYWHEMSAIVQAQRRAEAVVAPEQAPSYLHDRVYAAYREAIRGLDEAPLSHMAQSTVESVAGASGLRMQHGIWPVSPYCTPELVRFCRRLPFEWRKNRRIQREFLLRQGCTREVAYPRQTEDFGASMALGLRQARKRIFALMQQSRLAEFGWLDPYKFLETYEAWYQDPRRVAYTTMDFYVVLDLEYLMASMTHAHESPAIHV